MAKKKTKVEKLNVLTIPIPLYRCSVVIFFGASLNGMIKTGIKHGIKEKSFNTDWKRWIEDNMGEGKGFAITYGKGNSDVLVWMWKRPRKLSEYAVLYHELYHATDQIAAHRHFQLNEEPDEPKAYLFEYLFRKVSEVLWK